MNKYILGFALLVTHFQFAFAQAPNWFVQTADYSNSMTITGVLNFNGTESTNEDDMIGAFINNECRGVAKPILVNDFNRWIIFLSVFSNNPTDEIKFKAFNSKTGTIVDIQNSILFVTNISIGIASAPYVWSNPTIVADSKIISFKIEGQEGETKINKTEISVIMPKNADLKRIVPVFELSSYSIARVNNLIQKSSVSEIDFTLPVKYEVTGINESSKTIYTVSVLAGDISILEADNTFSPNGDGINDFWILKNNELYRTCNFYIYSSSGFLVYESLGYNNDWAGKYKNQDLPQGTYYFVIKCPSCSSCKLSGFITLLR